MLKQTKETSPLKQFKDFYFSATGREELMELLNSKIYKIVENSIAGDKKRIDLKFLFSFYSQEFIICDSNIHASELKPKKKMDDFLLFSSFYLNRNLRLYKELVGVFEEFDFDEVKLRPEIEKLSTYIIDNHINPEVTKLILDSSSEKVGTLKERLRIYELRNGEHPLRLLNQKDLIEFLLFFADNEINLSQRSITKIDFENLVSEEVYKKIITLFNELVFNSLEDRNLNYVDFDAFSKLHAVGLISDHTTIKLFNKAISLSKIEDVEVRKIYEFFYHSFYGRGYTGASFYLLTQEVLSGLSDDDLLENLSYLMRKVCSNRGAIKDLIRKTIMPEIKDRKMKVSSEFTVNEASFTFLAFNFGDYFFNNFLSIKFEIKGSRIVRLFFNLVDNTHDQINTKKMISVIGNAKKNGLSFKISEEAKANLELLIKSIDSGLSVSDNGHFNKTIKSFYSVLD
ncbi:MAG: hypothetical protein HXM94_00565 [Parvimonas micra]|uniref:Uncharacterized protein n=1 Tax=Parvimonas micra TaxID=33033 RepID=A0A930DYM8_9FIRM|nr:hypothetical protein [Parvimonas micra]MBF1306266.1 hypothetical protein [Parvimonas micra]